MSVLSDKWIRKMSKEEEIKPKTLDTSKPITLDFLTNPDKE